MEADICHNTFPNALRSRFGSLRGIVRARMTGG